MSLRLKDFIAGLRACKNGPVENAYVAKELAAIRAAFANESSPYRHRNVAKLLFIGMLGHNIQFGQMECLKLISSSTFVEKKIGYLSLCCLFDDDSELLMLSTNSIKNDLINSNQYINSAALVGLGNMGTMEIARELFKEVDELLNSTNPSLKKKTLFCASRMVQFVPDFDSKLLTRMPRLLDEKNHGVLLGAMAVLNSLVVNINSDSSSRQIGSFIIPVCRILRELIQASPANVMSENKSAFYSSSVLSASPEHDIGGVNDPILQVQILKFLKNLLRKYPSVVLDTPENWTVFSSALSLCLSGPESSRHGSLAVILECLRIVTLFISPNANENRLQLGSKNDILGAPPSESRESFHIQVPSTARLTGLTELRASALNWLEKFLVNKDNTVRYVGILLLSSIVKTNTDLAQRHRATVVSCLHDSDPTIQKQAAHLAFALTNTENAEAMVNELLTAMLVLTDPLPLVAPGPKLKSPFNKQNNNQSIQPLESAANNSSTPNTPTEPLKSSSNYIMKQELISDIVQMIALCADRYAPSRVWQLDNLIRLSCLAGNHIPTDVKSSLSLLLLSSPEQFQLLGVYKMFAAVCTNIYQVSLTEIGAWAFGEFANLVAKYEQPKSISQNELIDDVNSPKINNNNKSEDSSNLNTPTPQTNSVNKSGPQKLSVDLLLDLIERIVSVYGLDISASEVPCAAATEGIGIAAPLSSSCIKSHPSTKSHNISAQSLRDYPAAFLPQETRDCLTSGQLPSVISVALFKIAGWVPRVVPRCLSVLDSLNKAARSSTLAELIDSHVSLLKHPQWSSLRNQIIVRTVVVASERLEILQSRPVGDFDLDNVGALEVPPIPQTPESSQSPSSISYRQKAALSTSSLPKSTTDGQTVQQSKHVTTLLDDLDFPVDQKRRSEVSNPPKTSTTQSPPVVVTTECLLDLLGDGSSNTNITL